MNNTQNSITKPESQILIRRYLLMLVMVVFALGPAYLFLTHSRSKAAEHEACDYIRLHGSTSSGYSMLLPFGGIRINGPTSGVAIPINALSDNMADHLLRLRNLSSVHLYPPSPDEKVKFREIKHWQLYKSMGEFDSRLSEEKVRLLDEKFPNLIIRVAEDPNEAETEAEK